MEAMSLTDTHLAAGFTVCKALRLTHGIGAYINGIVLAEVAPSPAQQSSLPSAAAALKLPALDGAFEYGLACILDGAQKRLPNKHRGRS